MEEKLKRTQEEFHLFSLLVGWELSLEPTFFTFFRSKSDVSLSPTAERGLISRVAACLRAVKTHGIIYFLSIFRSGNPCYIISRYYCIIRVIDVRLPRGSSTSLLVSSV